MAWPRELETRKSNAASRHCSTRSLASLHGKAAVVAGTGWRRIFGGAGRNAPAVAHVTIDCDGHALRWLVNCDKNIGNRCLAALGGGRGSAQKPSIEAVGVQEIPTRYQCPVWRCLERGRLSRVIRRLEFGNSEPGEPVLGVWGLGAGLGTSRKSEHPSQSSNA